MQPEYARNVIAMLEKEKRGHFGAEALKKIKDALFREPDKALDNAYDRIVLHFNSLPSAAKLLEIVQEEAKKIKMAAAKQNEEEIERQKPHRNERTFLTLEQQTEYGKRCQAIMKAATPLNERGEPIQPTADQFKALVETCEAMQKVYPNEREGWGELKAHFVSKGLNLKDTT